MVSGRKVGIPKIEIYTPTKANTKNGINRTIDVGVFIICTPSSDMDSTFAHLKFCR